MQKICSTTTLEDNAISIKLFDGSIWTNILNGKFINIKTYEIESITRIYQDIKTAVGPGRKLIAKRRHHGNNLYLVNNKKIKSISK